MARLQIMGSSGHDTVEWKTDNKRQTRAAKKRFDELIADYHIIYQMERPGDTKGIRVTTFDPNAEELVAFRQMVGG